MAAPLHRDTAREKVVNRRNVVGMVGTQQRLTDAAFRCHKDTKIYKYSAGRPLTSNKRPHQ